MRLFDIKKNLLFNMVNNVETTQKEMAIINDISGNYMSLLLDQISIDDAIYYLEGCFYKYERLRPYLFYNFINKASFITNEYIELIIENFNFNENENAIFLSSVLKYNGFSHNFYNQFLKSNKQKLIIAMSMEPIMSSKRSFELIPYDFAKQYYNILINACKKNSNDFPDLFDNYEKIDKFTNLTEEQKEEIKNDMKPLAVMFKLSLGELTDEDEEWTA